MNAIWLYFDIFRQNISVIDLNHVWSKLCWLCWINHIILIHTRLAAVSAIIGANSCVKCCNL